MTKLTILFQLRLSATNPAPPELHTFNIEASSYEQIKILYKEGVQKMREKYDKHQYFKRLTVTEDKTSLLALAGVLDLPTFETE